jgi:hypothetical protein
MVGDNLAPTPLPFLVLDSPVSPPLTGIHHERAASNRRVPRTLILQTLTRETLFLAALPVPVHQNDSERRTPYETLGSKDLCDSPGPAADIGVLGIQRAEIRIGRHCKNVCLSRRDAFGLITVNSRTAAKSKVGPDK